METKTEYKGLYYRIETDTDPLNPRECDNLGVMVCFHKRYSLGDKTDLKSENFDGWAELSAYLKKEKKAVCIIPLFLLDHSGISMRAGRDYRDCDSGGWDSCCVGFIYTTRELIKKMGTKKKDVEAGLIAEVKEYSAYISGDTWGYIVEDADGDESGEQLDSCFSYFGSEYAIKDAKDFIDYYTSRRRLKPGIWSRSKR